MAFYPLLLNPSQTNIWTEASIADRTPPMPGSSKFNPYFEKWMHFQREGISISCGIHAWKCVTIEYRRDKGFNSLEFLGFKAVNHAGSGVIVERSATALKFTFKKGLSRDYRGITDRYQQDAQEVRGA